VQYAPAVGSDRGADGGQRPADREGATDLDAWQAFGASATAARDRLALALSVGGLGLWTWDRATRRIAWDARLLAAFGRSLATAPATIEAWLELVHPDDRADVGAMLVEAASGPEPARMEFRLVRADGQVRWLECSGRALFEQGDLIGAIGVMADVTERHETEARTRDLLRLVQLNADLSMTLSASLDPDVILQRLADRLVPDLADVCVVDLRDGLGSRSQVAVAARRPELRRLMEEAERRLPRRHNPASALARTLASGVPTLVADSAGGYISGVVPDAAVAALYQQLGMRSLLVAPLVARGEVLGAISLVRTVPPGGGAHDRAPYGPDDVDVAMELGRRAGLAVDNARLYAGERAIAEALQRALLPAIEAPPGVAVAARYLPASASVGGDWYDLFELPDGGTSITIGDVVGHDLRAAASMGQLRSVIRSYASEGAAPDVVLDRADRLVQSFSMAQLATAFSARLVGGGTQPWRLTYANAGHPPPLVCRPDGAVSLLEDATGAPIGAPHRGRRPSATIVLPPGSTLVCYTDGLVERRERDLDIGLRRMTDLVRSGAWRAGGDRTAGRLEVLCDLLIDELVEPDRSDDVALLALTVA
jgi:GAF domain-containing protein